MTMMGLDKYYKYYRMIIPESFLRLRKDLEIETAKKFLVELPSLSGEAEILERDYLLQQYLFTLCRSPESSTRALAALCLRCFVTHAVKKAIEALLKKFNGFISNYNQQYLREDLVSYFLNDGGEERVFILEDNKNYLKFKTEQIVLRKKAEFEIDQETIEIDQETIETAKKLVVLNNENKLVFYPFSFEILSTYNYQHQRGMSLDDWTIRQIMRSRLVAKILKQYGITKVTYLRALKSCSSKLLKKIGDYYYQPNVQTEIDIEIHQSFKETYELLLLNNQVDQKNILKPDSSVIKRLFSDLQEKEIPVYSQEELVNRLKDIAKSIIKYRQERDNPESVSGDEPISDKNHSSNKTVTRQDIIPDSKDQNSFEHIKKQNIDRLRVEISQYFYPVFNQNLNDLLKKSLKAIIINRFNNLRNSRAKVYNYTHYLLVLRHFYNGSNQREIANSRGIKQYNISRLLSLENLIEDSYQRCYLIELFQLFSDWLNSSPVSQDNSFLKKIEALSIWGEDNNSIKLSLLQEEIEEIRNIFEEAKREIHVSDQRRESIFAEIIQQIVAELN